MKRTKQNGITLIALVITIVVLLILAAVSIATLTGENGILTQANSAKEQTEIASVKEQAQLDIANWMTERLRNGESTELNDETVKSIIETANAQNTNPYYKELQSDRIITPSGYEIPYSELYTNITGGETTIGEIYDDSMIGQEVNYTANEQSEWIIFGKDSSGNILLTTKTPIADGFNLTVGPKSWLTYEEDLKQECSGYGGTIKDKQVTSRSITMEDINYVTGFDVDSLNFDTYTFGTELDYANKKVDYYFPSEEKDEDEEENDYWKKATTEAEAQQFENNWYYYYQDGDSILYGYSGGNDLDATSMINVDRFKYIIGEDGSYEYLVASRSVGVYSGNAYFCVARVGISGVNARGYGLCYSDSGEGGDDEGDYGLLGIRPIVVLPSDIEVEENESGQWDIAY